MHIKLKNNHINIQPLNIHWKDKKKDIVILTSMRSGGTWLLELMSYNKNIRPISEPLSLSLVNHPRKNDFFAIRPQEGYSFIKLPDKIHSYFEDILNGSLHPFGYIKTIRKNFRNYHFITNRTIIKLCHGKGLINWFYENFDVQLLYFFRHPIPSSISRMNQLVKNKKPLITKSAGFLNDEYFVNKYLTGDKVEFANFIEKNGSDLQRFVLSWVLENIISYTEIMAGLNIKYLSYEEFLTCPFKSINWIAENFALSKNKMQKFYNKSSSTTTKSFDRNQYGANNILINEWRKKVTNDEEIIAFEILEKFKIDMYYIGKDLPNQKFLNFKE